MKTCKIQDCKNEKGFAKKGFCDFHYKINYDLNKPNQPKPIKNPKVYKSKVKEKRNNLTGETQVSFLFRSLELITDNCQCCNEPFKLKSINNCAHILEKSRESFFIVSNNIKNIVYLCEDCHYRFDNKGKEWFESQSNDFKQLIYDRVTYLKNYLTESQQTHIKEYLNK